MPRKDPFYKELRMIHLLVAAAMAVSPVSGPKAGETYEICPRPWGVSHSQNCADPSPPNGVEIKGVVVQNCDLPREKPREEWTVCFTYTTEHGKLTYHIHKDVGNVA